MYDYWKFNHARAVTSPSGQGVIVQYRAFFYELECNIQECKWKILPQTLEKNASGAIVVALPPGIGC